MGRVTSCVKLIFLLIADCQLKFPPVFIFIFDLCALTVFQFFQYACGDYTFD